MLVPPKALGDWKVTTVGDDIAWIKPDANGQLRAINPEIGIFGVALGTSAKTNPNAMASLSRNTIFTNVAADAGWRRVVGRDDGSSHRLRVHGLARRAVASGDPGIWADRGQAAARPEWELYSARPSVSVDRCGVAGSGRARGLRTFIFGGRRSTTMPLVYQAFNWSAGVYVGATMGSETTAAASGAVGLVRRDPMAMLPFCGYHMGTTIGFRHWIKMQRSLSKTPRIFNVNWFRKRRGREISCGRDSARTCGCWRGSWTRCMGARRGKESPTGWTPYYHDDACCSVQGSRLSQAQFRPDAVDVNRAAWRRTSSATKSFFIDLHDHLPSEIIYERELLICRM